MEITELNDGKNIIDEIPSKIYIVNIKGRKNILAEENLLNDFQLDKVKKIADNSLVSFSTHTIPEKELYMLIKNYPDSIWIVGKH